MIRLIILALSLTSSLLGVDVVRQFVKSIQVDNKQSGIENVDCIYVINLDARPDRWKKLKPALREQKLHANRVSAVNGWQLTEKDKKALTGPLGVRLRGGEYGALLSHLSIINHAYQNAYRAVWVLEDDVLFQCKARSTISNLINELTLLDPDWDILYTDTNHRRSDGVYTYTLARDPRPGQTLKPMYYYLKREPVGKSFMRVRSRYGTHSLIISKKGLEKIWRYFFNTYVWSQIDVDIHYIPTIRQYCTHDDLVTNSYLESSDTLASSKLNHSH